MTIARLYVSPKEPKEGRLVLEGHDHHHLSRVLRMRRGQEAGVLDGNGALGRAFIVEITASRTVIAMEYISRVDEEHPRLHLFQAIPEGKKMDNVVQACVELGVISITPFSSRRSRPLSAAGEGKVGRWRKIAVESSRLAGRPAGDSSTGLGGSTGRAARDGRLPLRRTGEREKTLRGA